VGVVDEERGSGPHAAPVRGERGGAPGVLGGEAVDDVGEERVREAADVILAVVVRPVVGSLGLGVGGAVNAEQRASCGGGGGRRIANAIALPLLEPVG